MRLPEINGFELLYLIVNVLYFTNCVIASGFCGMTKALFSLVIAKNEAISRIEVLFICPAL